MDNNESKNVLASEIDAKTIISCIDYWDRKRIPLGENQARYLHNAKLCEAILEAMLQRQAEALGIDLTNIESTVDVPVNVAKQEELPFKADKAPEAKQPVQETAKPVVVEESKTPTPKEREAQEPVLWDEFKDIVESMLKVESFDDVVAYAESILATGNYVPAKERSKARAWNTANIIGFVKDISLRISRDQKAAEVIQVKAEETPTEIITDVVDADIDAVVTVPFTEEELNDIAILKDSVAGIFDVPGATSSDSVATNGKGSSATKQRIKEYGTRFQDDNSEAEALEVLFDTIQRRKANKAALMAKLNKTEADIIADNNRLIDLFFANRDYTPAAKEEWRKLTNGEKNVQPPFIHFTVLNGEATTPCTDAAPVVETVEAVEVVEEKAADSMFNDAKLDALFAKCVHLGMNNQLIQDEYAKLDLNELEQMAIFLANDEIPDVSHSATVKLATAEADASYAETLEDVTLSIVAERICAFFGSKRTQQEVDSFNSLINTFFEKRAYDRKERKNWVNAAKTAGSGVNNTTLMQSVRPFTPATEVVEESVPTAKAEPVAESKPAEVAAADTEQRFVKKASLLKNFKKAIANDINCEDVLKELEDNLKQPNGKYADVVTISEDGSIKNTIVIANHEGYIQTMEVIWGEAIAELAASTPIKEEPKAEPAPQSQGKEITSMVELTAEGFRILKTIPRPTYEEFVAWVRMNAMNKLLRGQKPEQMFKDEPALLSFIIGTFGSNLKNLEKGTKPAAKPVAPVVPEAPVVETPAAEAPEKIKSLSLADQIAMEFPAKAQEFKTWAESTKWTRERYVELGIANGRPLAYFAQLAKDLCRIHRPDLLAKIEAAKSLLEAAEAQKTTEPKEETPVLAVKSLVSNELMDRIAQPATLASVFEIAKLVCEEGDVSQALNLCLEVLPTLEGETKNWDRGQISAWFTANVFNVVKEEAQKDEVKAPIKEVKPSTASENDDVIPELNACKNKQDFRKVVGTLFKKEGDTPELRGRMVATILQKNGTYSRKIGKMPASEIHKMIHSVKNRIDNNESLEDTEE